MTAGTIARRLGIGTVAVVGVVLLGDRPSAQLQAGAARLLPVDEAPQQTAFFSFRAHLQAAIARRDTAALLAVVDPQIKASFGGDGGIADFRRMWGLDGEPDDPPDGSDDIWTELGTVLALGGSFSGDETFTAPYTFSRWPDDFDAFDHVVMTAADVRIRAAPDQDAPVLDADSFAILLLTRSAAPSDTWTAVQLGTRTGYVSSRLVRSPIDYRAIFTRTSGRWRLAMFLAGD